MIKWQVVKWSSCQVTKWSSGKWSSDQVVIKWSSGQVIPFKWSSDFKWLQVSSSGFKWLQSSDLTDQVINDQVMNSLINLVIKWFLLVSTLVTFGSDRTTPPVISFSTSQVITGCHSGSQPQPQQVLIPKTENNLKTLTATSHHTDISLMQARSLQSFSCQKQTPGDWWCHVSKQSEQAVRNLTIDNLKLIN